MRKLIAAMNMTLDGYCDHTAMAPDDQIHQHYADMLGEAGALLYGRTTYLMMESYWPQIVKEPTGNKATDDFALAMEAVPKIVFSRTMKQVSWKSATLKNELVREEILDLKRQPGKPLFAGSPGLIVALSNLGLVDEYQLGVFPLIAGSGLPLFKGINGRIELKFMKAKAFSSGAVISYYERLKTEG